MNKKQASPIALDLKKQGADCEMISFQPSPNLTFHTVTTDRARLLTCLHDKHVTGLCFDLNHVKQCDSAGLALLIEARRLCDFYHKTFSITAMPQKVADLIEFCGVKTILS